MEAVIKVTAEGASCLYTELIDLGYLGSMKATRVSEIEFNEVTQEWEAVELETGKVIAAHHSRSVVIEAEAEYFGEKL